MATPPAAESLAATTHPETDAVPQEIEAKLLVASERDLRRLAGLTELGPYRLSARPTQRLRTIYLDTAGFALARAGIALRLRRDGATWEATAKWEGTVADEVHARPELTVSLNGGPPLPFTLPAGPLATHLTAIVAGRALYPFVVTEMQRRRFDVLAAGARAPLAELALDRVHLLAPRERRPRGSYWEVEIELRHGGRRELSRLIRLLRQHVDLQPSVQSKLARAVGAVYGEPIRRDAPPDPVTADDTTELAARKVMARHLAKLRQNDPRTRLGRDPEALHDMRVATRRLRAAVRAFRPGMLKRLRHYLSEELTWLGRLLGAVRDLDVQLQHLASYTAAQPAEGRDLLHGFRGYLEAERRARRGEMLAALDSPRYLRVLVEIEAFARGDARLHSYKRSAHELVAAMGRRSIQKALERLLKDGGDITPAAAPEELHALRIRAKRTRYLLEFLRELTGREGKRLVKQLVRLQDELGAHQDAIVAIANVRRYLAHAGDELGTATLVALDALIDAHQQRARSARRAFEEAWRPFAARRRVTRDLRAVRDHLQHPDMAPAPPNRTTPRPRRRAP
jgi:inorganic triphosphatase YgiF